MSRAWICLLTIISAAAFLAFLTQAASRLGFHGNTSLQDHDCWDEELLRTWAEQPELFNHWLGSLREYDKQMLAASFSKSTLTSRKQFPVQAQMAKGAVTKPRKDDGTTGRLRSGPVLGCEQFSSTNYSWPQPLRTIALVGNGPLKAESLEEINSMDLVVRFNKLQSYRCGDKFDVWASRHGDAVTTRYWGIGQKLNISCPLNRLLELSQHIWLLNGGDGPFEKFMSAYPAIRDKGNFAWLDCRRWVLRYMRSFDPKTRSGSISSTQDEISPSSGWLVLNMVRDCAPKGAEIHIFGFNWPGGQWKAHQVEKEKREIQQLAAKGLVTIHETQCKHKYYCNKTDLAG